MALLTALSLTDVNDLRTEANNFDDHAIEVRNITDDMLRLIDSTQNVWRGEARTAYTTQFNGLSTEMADIYKLIHLFCEDLRDIAQKYETAETDNKATASALEADIEIIK